MHGTRLSKLLVTTMLLAFSGIASAGSATANLNVSASVAANCTIATSPVNFGAYDPVVANATTPLNATGAVTIACTKGAAPTITLALGANASGSTRRMTDGTNYLNYELYQQSGQAPNGTCNYSTPTVWGTTGTNSFLTDAAPSKAARSYNVCGQVAAGQDVPSATYNDIVEAAVNF